MLRRRLRTVVVFLLLGAIVNVAVAWAISLLLDPFSIKTEEPRFRWGQRLLHDDQRQWNVTVRWTTGANRLSAYIGKVRPGDKNQGEDPAEIVPHWWPHGLFMDQPSPEVWAKLADKELWEARLPKEEGDQFYSFAEARGWPLVSMWYELRHSDRPTARMQMEAHGAIELPLPIWTDPMPFSSYDQPRALPLRVIWPGFAINTIFYAAILWMMFAVPGRFRRWRRIKRGLCPVCTYPVGTSDVCVERWKRRTDQKAERVSGGAGQ